ncbi:MAG: hypothetical protein HPY55_06550 [Firmicutes bacterium]|nr:hypothetical protein [Bacillota bacterium]
MNYLRYAKLGEEAVHGTAVAGAVTVDPESSSLDSPGDQALFWPGASGLDRQVAPAPYVMDGDLVVALDDVVAGWILKWLLGANETTGTGPYTHVFTPSRAPLLTPFTVRLGKDIFEHVFAGCVLDSLQIEVGAEFVKATLGILASKDEKAALAGAIAWSEGNIFAPHQVTAEIDSVDASARVEDLKLSIKNNADLKSGRTVGSRFARRGYRGALEVTGDLTLSFIDSAELERFWGTATGPTSTTLTEFPLSLNFGTSLVIELARCVYTAMGQPLAGRDRIVQKGSLRALVTTAGDGPIEATLTNDQARYDAV